MPQAVHNSPRTCTTSSSCEASMPHDDVQWSIDSPQTGVTICKKTDEKVPERSNTTVGLSAETRGIIRLKLGSAGSNCARREMGSSLVGNPRAVSTPAVQFGPFFPLRRKSASRASSQALHLPARQGHASPMESCALMKLVEGGKATRPTIRVFKGRVVRCRE